MQRQQMPDRKQTGVHMQFTKVIIVSPGFEQRISKMAYSFVQMGIPCEVLAEEAQIADEFNNYIQGIPFSVIPCSDKLKRTPLGSKRARFIRERIEAAARSEKGVLVIARDVNYGCIVTGITNRKQYKNVLVITDVADNYDLLFASYSNIIKKIVYKAGFRYLTKKAFKRSDALLVVTPVNVDRIRRVYPFMNEKPILILRNLPLKYEFIHSMDKVPKSFVYVGKIDEISRDPMYVVEKLKELSGYSLHFYSSQKASTIERIKEEASRLGVADRIVFHQRVPYDDLAKEISKYSFGLVPHKRSPITDYTVPNKIYDYKSSGIVTVMSDCPSLVYENREYGFGVVYSKERDDFCRKIAEAENYQLDFSIKMPVWKDEFVKVARAIENLAVDGKDH